MSNEQLALSPPASLGGHTASAAHTNDDQLNLPAHDSHVTPPGKHMSGSDKFNLSVLLL